MRTQKKPWLKRSMLYSSGRRAILLDPVVPVFRTLLRSYVRRDRVSDEGHGPERTRREETAGPARAAAAGRPNACSS